MVTTEFGFQTWGFYVKLCFEPSFCRKSEILKWTYLHHLIIINVNHLYSIIFSASSSISCGSIDLVLTWLRYLQETISSVICGTDHQLLTTGQLQWWPHLIVKKECNSCWRVGGQWSVALASHEHVHLKVSCVNMGLACCGNKESWYTGAIVTCNSRLPWSTCKKKFCKGFWTFVQCWFLSIVASYSPER